MKDSIGLILFLAVLWFMLFSVITANIGGDNLEDRLVEYQELVGESVVVTGDTLVIIDYSFVNSNFILNNGATISKSYIDKYGTLKY